MKNNLICRTAAIIMAAVLSLSLFALCETNKPNTPTESNTSGCVDGKCEVPEYNENGNQVYAIVSPVGYHDVEMIEQADRLDTLEGKTIALVGGSFMASVTHNELKNCIAEKYPHS